MTSILQRRGLGSFGWVFVETFLTSVERRVTGISGFVLHVDHEANGGYVDKADGGSFANFAQIRHCDEILLF